MSSRYFAAFCLRVPNASAAAADAPPLRDPAPCRFGFTVPKALGKAVHRNRVKRRMREAVRSQLAASPANHLIVFNPRRNVLAAPFPELCREVGRIFERCATS